MSQEQQPPSDPAGDPLAPPPPPSEPVDLTGQTLAGDFKILRRLGQGGMGQVYLAEQISLKRKVALKLLKAELSANPTSLKRFTAEAEVVARLTHANIVQVHAIGEAFGSRFMALEYVEGTNLRDYVAKKGPPDVPLALSIMRQVAAALARAGELGITHRDIKPENILLTRKAEVKVTDFGLSRDDRQPLNVTQTGVTMGTPLYMSPEQVQGHPVDPRSDVYSFGVTCYHMLSGNPPFQGKSAFEVAMHHVQTQPTPLHAVRPDLPAELCAVVDRLMAKKPEDRYQTGREILRELNRLRELLTGSGQQPTTAPGVGPSSGSMAAVSSKPSGTALALSISAESQPGRSWRWLAVPLSLLLALLAGGALALIRQHAPDNGRGDQPLISEQERVLRQEVDATAQPGDDAKRIERGLRARLNLGMLLIETGRVKDAGELFAGLSEHSQPDYGDLGKLGQAIVLAYQDQPGPSNQLFLECQKKIDAAKGPFWGQPRLRFVMARALDRNAANGEAGKETMPAELDRLRHPATLLATPPRKTGDPK